MFTVIIAEQEHIQKIREYEMFLKPFLESGDVVFCQWNQDAERLKDMLPTLAQEVGRRKEWRAVILCNEDGLLQQNPFDLVKNLPGKFEGPIRGSSNRTETYQDEDSLIRAEHDLDYIYSEEYKAFLQQEHEKKLLAYEEASANPLTRLVTFFCNAPTITKQMDSVMMDGDPDYKRYIIETSRKQQLREKILGDEVMETSQPAEILCIAKRTYVSAEKEFDTVWSSHTEMEYSRFCDRNMYFDKMRYLIFDILPKAQRDYTFDYIRFLYATILLASNDIPHGCLANERIYSLRCENDEAALSSLLQTYEVKLETTKSLLQHRIQEIKDKKPVALSDLEAQQLFCAKTDQAVIMDSSFSQTELNADHSKIGLADGCPQDEAILWDREYHKSQKALAKMLKQSRRALRRTAATARNQQDAFTGQIANLSQFQLEDIQEFIDNQELEMLRTNTVDLYSEEVFHDQMEAANKRVRKKIETRMYKGTTLALGGLGCLLFLLGFFTIFLNGATYNVLRIGASLLLLGISVGVFALIGFITLFFLRNKLVSGIKDYNDTVQGIGHQVYGAMNQYGKYLSHMYNMRRGYAMLDAVARREDPDHDKIVLYTKHISDIDRAKAEVRDVFGQFMLDHSLADTNLLNPYDYNFDIPAEYHYPLPYTEGTSRKITFIQSGVDVKVPVQFVKEITVRREELYE